MCLKRSFLSHDGIIPRCCMKRQIEAEAPTVDRAELPCTVSFACCHSGRQSTSEFSAHRRHRTASRTLGRLLHPDGGWAATGGRLLPQRSEYDQSGQVNPAISNDATLSHSGSIDGASQSPQPQRLQKLTMRRMPPPFSKTAHDYTSAFID